MSDYDFIVVGAGSAGCIAAGRAAQRGLKVLLLDAHEKEDIGHPWVDDVESDIFERLFITEPTREEAWPQPPRYRVVSPSGKRHIEKRGMPITGLRMSFFVRRLLDNAVGKFGVEFRGGAGAVVDGPLLDGPNGGRVRGVVVGGEEIPARLVLESSGLNAAVRRGLPESSPVQREIDQGCLVTAWREQRLLSEEEVPRALSSLEITPGMGYSRVGWRGGYSVRMLGFDSRTRVLDILVGFNLKRGGGETAGEYVRSFLASRGVGGELIYGGGGLIPVRRSLDVLVDDGLMLAGDAACMVVPAHGSGVASALIAGDLAARTAARVVKAGDTGRNALWEYCMTYQRGRGAMMAYFDFMRLLTETLSEEEMEKLVGSAMTPLDIEIGLAVRPLPLRPDDALRRLKGLRHPLFSSQVRQPGTLLPVDEDSLRALPRALRPARDGVVARRG